MFWNVKGNGAMYKKFNIKSTNWIIVFSFCKSSSSLSKGITCSNFHQFQQFFVPLNALRKELWSSFGCQKKTCKEFKLKNTNWIVLFGFCKSASSFSKGITCSFFHWFQHFLYYWMSQVEKYKFFLKLKSNGIMYE